MTGVKLAKAFGFLLMVVIVCSKQIPEEQIPEEQHSTYPATDEAHFTTNALHEHHDEDLNAGKRLIRAAAAAGSAQDYQGGATTNGKKVFFHLRPNKKIANRNELSKKLIADLDDFTQNKIKAGEIFSQNPGTLDNSPKENFRLDMQGMVKRGARGQEQYHNLQVQWNVKRDTKNSKLKSTTFANILVPRNAKGLLGDQVVRRAFTDSSENNAEVTLEIK